MSMDSHRSTLLALLALAIATELLLLARMTIHHRLGRHRRSLASPLLTTTTTTTTTTIANNSDSVVAGVAAKVRSVAPPKAN